MKPVLLVVLSGILLLTSCKKKEKVQATPMPKEFSFLIGDWERTNDEDGKHTYEHWKSSGDHGLCGSSYTLQNKDTTFKETFRLFKKDTTWTLRIFEVHDTPTDFTVTSKSNHSFTAENSENEFPSKISYNYFDDVLTAQVTGERMEISFIYWRATD